MNKQCGNQWNYVTFLFLEDSDKSILYIYFKLNGASLTSTTYTLLSVFWIYVILRKKFGEQKL